MCAAKQFCDASQAVGSECLGPCASTDGLALTLDACVCGEDVCAANQFCDASQASGSECARPLTFADLSSFSTEDVDSGDSKWAGITAVGTKVAESARACSCYSSSQVLETC